MKRLRIFYLLLAIFAIAAAAAYSESGKERQIDKTYNTSSIQRIEVQAHVGSIRMVSSNEEQIRLRILLGRKKFEDVDLSSIDLVETFNGNLLRLELEIPFDKDRVEQRWELSVPARLQADLDIDVGELDVKGVMGGVNLNTKVGKISCDVPQGKIHARAGVGSIKAISNTPSYGKVTLDSDVGNVKLNLSSHVVKHSKPPGAGNRISLEGPGKDDIDLSVNVGNAELQIGPSKE